MTKKIYWLSDLPARDDFNQPYKGVMYDAKTKSGPWANMTEGSWKKYGVGRLGTGFGQKYVLNAEGRWEKVEG